MSIRTNGVPTLKTKKLRWKARKRQREALPVRYKPPKNVTNKCVGRVDVLKAQRKAIA